METSEESVKGDTSSYANTHRDSNQDDVSIEG